ncbi:MAG TPA: type II toxin-antitoxin system RelE/ParE family toxin [Burkholderiaceae bacterium]
MTRDVPKPLVRRARADTDVEAAIDHYLTESAEIALGFVDALEAAYAHIRRAPATGSPRYAHELNLPGLRFWPCRRYPYLVFYLERRERIEIWRVLHASRDIPQWLQDEGQGAL